MAAMRWSRVLRQREDISEQRRVFQQNRGAEFPYFA